MAEKDALLDETVVQYLQKIPDDVLSHIAFSVPWQHGVSDYGGLESSTDEDGFPVLPVEGGKETPNTIRKILQSTCWDKAHDNPHINTSVRGLVGRITGWGFETTSESLKVQRAIEEIELDERNRLYYFWPKYIARLQIEGELYVCLTLHADGFVEIDFIDPSTVDGSVGGNCGIIFHPNKTLMPLMYNIRKNGVNHQQIPSIFCARYPELLALAAEDDQFDAKLQGKSKSRKQVFSRFKGYNKFIVGFDKGFVTKRAVSYLRTTLQWINHYENLKKYEIDHKKSAGSYLWIFKIIDPKSFKLWLSLSDEDRKKTGIMAKKSPGSSLVLPPGMEVEVVNPTLTSIKDQDTDVLEMIGSGLNEPGDVLTGTPRGPYASVKASRGPMSDRVSDEIAYFDRWYKHHFWSSIFFLKSSVSNFPSSITVEEATEFDGGEPKFEKVKRRPEQLIDVSYPSSEVIDLESRSRALLGVKHGPMSEQLGIPNSEVARRIGIGGYARMRLRKATEDKKFPELVYEAGVDTESVQESVEGEPGKKE